MPARTASSSTSAALGALALGLLALGAGCNTQAPASSVPAEALCPDTMKGDGTAEFPLSGLTIIRFETGKGSANVTPAGDESRQEWLLPPAPDVYYRAACEYDEEIIGVPIEADIRRCWLERKPGSPVTTGCQKG
jgi:hypothetical protein